ncbi:serpin B4-like [Teleopsis dalmanni]|uniref:serpin B4-like n=1 Tax=Teleopsis dalmanni TaxID=139649 RepID=UPI0018CDF50F|nr:serpin B4-like [Teleopsis dalmanni]
MKNFLISPYGILELLENLNTNAENVYRIEETNAEKNFDSQAASEEYETFHLHAANPIKVSNTLQTDKDLRMHSRLHATAGLSSNETLPNNLTATENEVHTNLINAVTLNSRWAFNFQKRDTHKRIFYTKSNAHYYVDMMRKDDIFPYAKLEHLNATALELSLQQSDLKMLILLPNAVNGLAELERKLMEDPNLINVIGINYLRPTLVRILLPKFHMLLHINISTIFMELLQKTFNETVEFEPKIQKFIQKVHIEVGESGFGEVQKQTVLFWNAHSSVRTTPETFSANHPFLFMIRNHTDIHFLGHLVNIE